MVESDISRRVVTFNFFGELLHDAPVVNPQKSVLQDSLLSLQVVIEEKLKLFVWSRPLFLRSIVSSPSMLIWIPWMMSFPRL